MNKKILIVEDDSFLSGLEAGKLQKEGFDVLTAANGADGLKIIETNPNMIACILLDLMLPNVDGFAVLESIRAGTTEKPPIIVFSNLADDESLAKATNLGATAYMIKSNFTLDELVEKVREVTK